MKFEIELDGKAMDEISKKTYSKYYSLAVHVFAVICLALAYFSFHSHIKYLFIFIGCAVLMEITLCIAKRKAMKRNRELMYEVTKGKNIKYQYELEDDFIHVHNITTGSQTEMPYGIFKNYIETEHYAILLTKSRQFIALDKITATENAIKGFLKSKKVL